MQTYIGFLRGINVSGQKKIKMADLKISLEKIGFLNVHTYIQSGNIVFSSSESSIQMLQEKIQSCIKKKFGFDVPVMLVTKGVIKNILHNYPFKNAEEKNKYFVLLYTKPQAALQIDFELLEFKNEEFQVKENCIYLNCKIGAGKAKLNTNLIERKLKVIATTRNLKTMQKMLELAD